MNVALADDSSIVICLRDRMNCTATRGDGVAVIRPSHPNRRHDGGCSVATVRHLRVALPERSRACAESEVRVGPFADIIGNAFARARSAIPKMFLRHFCARRSIPCDAAIELRFVLPLGAPHDIARYRTPFNERGNAEASAQSGPVVALSLVENSGSCGRLVPPRMEVI